jgi:hypothetical protein
MKGLGDFDGVYRLSQEIVKNDTLVFEAYMNLYLFELARQNHEKALYYWKRLETLVPWLMPRIPNPDTIR